jgi:hypothetical protein
MSIPNQNGGTSGVGVNASAHPQIVNLPDTCLVINRFVPCSVMFNSISEHGRRLGIGSLKRTVASKADLILFLSGLASLREI